MESKRRSNFFTAPFLFWGLRCGFALRRYALGLAVRSALRRLRLLGLALRATPPHR